MKTTIMISRTFLKARIADYDLRDVPLAGHITTFADSQVAT